MTRTTLIRKLTLADVAPPRRKRIIARLLVLGPLILATSTILFAYYIPQIDSSISEIDSQFASAEDASAQFQLRQSMGLVPYHLTTFLDLMASPPPWIKESLAYEIKKMQINSLNLLCWPFTPTLQQQATWKTMSFDELENEKLELTRSYQSVIQSLIERRRELRSHKLVLLFFATLLQVLGLSIMAAGSALHALRK